MVSEALQNINRPEYTISGLNLLPSQVSVLLRSVDPKYTDLPNTVLKHVNMARKLLSDESGVIVAESIGRNKAIEHCDISGNCLEAGAAEEFGAALAVNRSLKHLNLECNNLTKSGKNTKDYRGIKRLADALLTNTTLI